VSHDDSRSSPPQSPLQSSPQPPSLASPSLAGHLAIARADHWFKNVFAVPGFILAVAVDPQAWGADLIRPALLGLLALCLMASSNYTINEVVDAKFDLEHPQKRLRPVPSGRVSLPWAYVQWIGLMLVAFAIAWSVSWKLAATLGALWIMGALYNLPPIRTKDVPYLDVLSEGINNPLRLLAGWFVVDPGVFSPASLLVSYWMMGCYFMALKRFAEYRAIADPARAAAYRLSFAYYTESRLLVSVMFYASASMLFFGAFIMRYRIELILAFPLVALVMSLYLSLSLQDDSRVQRPEELYRVPSLVVGVAACAIAVAVLLVVDIPILTEWFAPWGQSQWR
jgi:4-hydroxybenzoate polyprenyltransferase